ncbi:MAG: metallopeptidase TldD-related protein [Planctomycetota bacterium]
MDRVQGHEIDFRGASFLRPEAKGDLQYGSEHVNLEANCTLEHGLDTRGWDDEGVPSQRWPIVDRGRFVGFFTDREFASAAGEIELASSSRAEGWYNRPIVRIPNLSLLPGSGTWRRCWRIPRRRGALSSTASAPGRSTNAELPVHRQAAWEVQGGKPGRRQAPTYQGRTLDFWRGCDAVCRPDSRSVRRAELRQAGNRTRSRRRTRGGPARFRG